MNNVDKNCFDDKAMAQDILNSEKALTGNYNTFICESATPEVRSALCDILNDVHRMQDELFVEMNAKGWYPTPKAEDTKVSEAKTKFENEKSTMAYK